MLPRALRAELKKTLEYSSVREARDFFYRLRFGRNLSKLAVAFKTDKEGGHRYAQHYQRHFHPLRRKPITLLEIGIGGYEDTRSGGESLRMWKAYFPRAKVYGIDLYDKHLVEERRIRTFKGSQADESFLAGVASEIGEIDIIIDDGSHQNDHVIKTFKVLFPLLAPRGIYVVEDLQTSYWEDVRGEAWGGSTELTASHTSMNFFKSLVDGLNHEEFTVERYVPSYFDRHIVGMHFYHNLLFVYKGENNEGSNVLGRRSAP